KTHDATGPDRAAFQRAHRQIDVTRPHAHAGDPVALGELDPLHHLDIREIGLDQRMVDHPGEIFVSGEGSRFHAKNRRQRPAALPRGARYFFFFFAAAFAGGAAVGGLHRMARPCNSVQAFLALSLSGNRLISSLYSSDASVLWPGIRSRLMPL